MKKVKSKKSKKIILKIMFFLIVVTLIWYYWILKERDINEIPAMSILEVKKEELIPIEETIEENIKIVNIEEITIDEKTVTLGVGQKYILKANILPEDATYQNMVWSSENEKIVTVDQSGNIKAESVGTTNIVVVVPEEEKKAVCVVTVSKTKPKNKILYAKVGVNLREGEGTSYKVIGSIMQRSSIEILKEGNNFWSKVRNSAGIVGYCNTSTKYFSTTKPIQKQKQETKKEAKITGVPYLNQFSLGYPTGCEAVSATMLLRYHGYKVSARQIVDKTPTDEKGKYQDEKGQWYGNNPFKVFVGHPSKQRGKGSYGCFAAPIVTAMKSFAGNKVKNISNCGTDKLFSYIDHKKPVVVWGIKNGANPEKGITWKYMDGSGGFEEIYGEHCFVLIGYDEKYVYLNDPSAGKNVKQLKSKFISNWKALFSQAIVIE